MVSYVGITIGPIFEAMQIAESPAGLWYSSTSFSELTRLLLCEITKQLPNADIISPYYNGEKYNDGIGRYHDRVIFATTTPEKVKDVVSAAKTQFIDMVLGDIGYNNSESEAKARAYLERFYQIHFVVLPKGNQEKNILLEISPLLDAIECMPLCNPHTTSNPIKSLITKKSEDNTSRNSRIKNSRMLNEVENSQLYRDNTSLKSIEDICGKNEGFKRCSYFAIISADGDGMSKFISLLDEAQTKEFSKDCFSFTQQAATTIGDFGGMTIYAGGDDLLFLAPIINSKQETVFELCNRLSDLFTEIVAKNQPSPTLSLGIAIRFAHSPLHEALNSAYEALSLAKSSREQKNSIFIDLQKHSGQANKLCISKEGFGLFRDIISPMQKQSDEAVNSIIYTLASFGSSLDFEGKDPKKKIENLFLNNYDNASQQQYRNYIKILSEKFYILGNSDNLIKLYANNGFDDSLVKCFEGILRIGKFLMERGVEQ